MAFTIGNTIGPYRIVDQIGQGGMATVFKAYHANLDRYVAFKVLHPAFKEDPTFLERFKREAQIVAKLEHPAIVPVYDYADYENAPYLVMKFVEGETLKARLKRQPLTLEETLEMLEVVAGGLSYAHEQGILHRDIKPSNIILDQRGTPYITDFGLARIAQAGESTLSQDMMLGTPQYISPEQAKGIRDLTPGTDIYSLGVLLYEIVVGRVPFNADTPYAIVHDHIYKPLPLPGKINPEVPPEIERVLLKALSKEPADRYASAPALEAAFRQAVQETGLTELGAARYRPSQMVSSTAATMSPENTGPQPITPAIPSPVAASGGSTASKQAYRRRANLWILGGFGALLLMCLFSMFVLVDALRDPALRPWEVSDAADDDAMPPPPPGDADGPDMGMFSSVSQQANAMFDQMQSEPHTYFDYALEKNQAGDPRSAQSVIDYALQALKLPPHEVADLAQQATAEGQPELAVWLWLHLLDQPGLDPDLHNDAQLALNESLRADLAATVQTVFTFANEHPDKIPHIAASLPHEAPLAFILALSQIDPDDPDALLDIRQIITDLDASSALISSMARFAEEQGNAPLVLWLYLQAVAQDDVTNTDKQEAGRYLKDSAASDPVQTLMITSLFLEHYSAEKRADLVQNLPREAFVYLALAMVEAGAGDQAAAFRSINTASRLEPSTELLVSMVKVAEMREMEELTLRLYLEMLADETLSPYVREEAGAFIYEQAQARPAATLATISVFATQHPDDPNILTAHALALALSDRALMQRQAGNRIEDALALDGELAEAYLVRGIYHYRMDQIDEARADWERAKSFADAPEWVVRAADEFLTNL